MPSTEDDRTDRACLLDGELIRRQTGADDMWTIDVRMQGDPAWLLIWSGDGGGAELDARKRHEQVRDHIKGYRHERENVHADRWEAVRLVHDGVAEEDQQVGVDDTKPFLAAPPPGRR
jgi:hypothetical protein